MIYLISEEDLTRVSQFHMESNQLTRSHLVQIRKVHIDPDKLHKNMTIKMTKGQQQKEQQVLLHRGCIVPEYSN